MESLTNINQTLTKLQITTSLLDANNYLTLTANPNQNMLVEETYKAK